MIHRKQLVRLHMKSGKTVRLYCRSVKINKIDGNTLSSITAEGGSLPFYVRLDDISVITYRKCWLHWGIGR